jgi:Recombinase
VTLTITTNTLSDWYVEPQHATLISTISSLASEGLTMKAIAETLNAQGFKSHSGRAFYSELVGALISKYRKKEKSRYIVKTMSVVNKDGGTV